MFELSLEVREIVKYTTLMHRPGILVLVRNLLAFFLLVLRENHIGIWIKHIVNFLPLNLLFQQLIQLLWIQLFKVWSLLNIADFFVNQEGWQYLVLHDFWYDIFPVGVHFDFLRIVVQMPNWRTLVDTMLDKSHVVSSNKAHEWLELKLRCRVIRRMLKVVHVCNSEP